jgi:hypothetical protein
VKVCTIGSFTGFVIPGSDVCLKIGGFVRWQYGYNPQEHTFFYKNGVGGYPSTVGDTLAKNAYTTGFGQSFGGSVAVGSVKLDARTTTEYGLLRSFADIRVNNSGGAVIDKAYIQFGQWSFGKFQSFFDFYADAYSNLTGLGSDNSVLGAAYSFSFGNGLFLTAALEDRNTGNLNAPAIGAPGTLLDDANKGVKGSVGGISLGGYRAPDLVAQLLYDPGANGWGSAQLSAALHQTRLSGLPAPDTFETKYGWAVQGGVKVNLPMLGAGDALYLQAAYTEGALTYIGANNTGAGFGATLPLVAYADAVAVGPGGSVKLTKGFNALAAIDHYITPNLDLSLWAGVTKVDYASGTLTGATFGARDFTIIQAGPQLSWVPAKGVRVTGTVNWYHVDTQTKSTDYISGVKAVDTKADGIQTLLRVQRDF